MMACNIAEGDHIVDLLLSKEADVNMKSTKPGFPNLSQEANVTQCRF